MKQVALLIIITSFFFGCEKIPTRQAITIELISINGVSQEPVYGSYPVAYQPEYKLAFSYESSAGLDSVHIRQLKSTLQRIEGVDENRIDEIPLEGSKKGKFIYTLNTNEQTDATGPGGSETNASIKIVLLNELGVIGERIIKLKIQ